MERNMAQGGYYRYIVYFFIIWRAEADPEGSKGLMAKSCQLEIFSFWSLRVTKI